MKRIVRFLINIIFKQTKLNEKYIAFLSSRGRIDGNPKALYLYIKKHYQDYQCYYFVHKGTNTDVLEKDDIIFYNSIKGLYLLSKCKYIILSDSVKPLINKKNHQIYIQTFHGHGPVKCMGLEIDEIKNMPEYASGKLDHVKDWDYYVSMCKEDDEQIKRATGYDKNVVRTGVASTDVIFNINNISQKKIIQLKKKYNIPTDKTVVLYAPTYREEDLQKDIVNVQLKSLSKLENYIFLIRLHPLLNNKLDKSIFENSNFINANIFSDIVDIYPITDILITDYSGSIYEFAITNRKIILYPYDYEKYDKYPGYAIDYKKEMPGPIAYNEKELFNILNNIDTYFKDYNKKLNKFNKKYNYLNDGNATKRLADLIASGYFKE